MNLEITFDALPLMGGVLVFISYYFPKFKTWYEGLTSEGKQQANALILGGITLAAVLGSVLGVVDIYGGETWQSWVVPPVIDWFAALIANVGTYKAIRHMVEQ